MRALLYVRNLLGTHQFNELSVILLFNTGPSTEKTYGCKELLRQDVLGGKKFVSFEIIILISKFWMQYSQTRV